MKKLFVTISLNYEPFLEYTKQGNCQMKCPLGDCILDIVLENSLKKIVQSVDVKAEVDFNEAK